MTNNEIYMSKIDIPYVVTNYWPGSDYISTTDFIRDTKNQENYWIYIPPFVIK
jgi:hypothetical protein